MKKMLFAALAAIVLCACSGEPDYLKVKGLSIGLPAKVFADSLLNRGFELDSAHSGAELKVFRHPGETAYSITMACQGDQIAAVEEDYYATYNDSTRALWQQLRDQFAEELGRNPGIPKRNDDHKIAEFETSEYKLVVTLDNHSVPFLSVLYEMKAQDK
jgi:hypothetical protein